MSEEKNEIKKALSHDELSGVTGGASTGSGSYRFIVKFTCCKCNGRTDISTIYNTGEGIKTFSHSCGQTIRIDFEKYQIPEGAAEPVYWSEMPNN